jgi:hypothetical protein
MTKRVAIVQSSYIPWKGYFDLIRAVDEFILLDDVQYTKRDWRNRNLIKTPAGKQWLTIPVHVKGRFQQTISETAVSDPRWAARHWGALSQNYAKAPYFRQFASSFEPLYEELARETSLSRINRRCIEVVCGLLRIETRISWSMQYASCEGSTDRLVLLCRGAGATHYLSGPSARAYLQSEKFVAAGIALQYADYAGYPAYPQLWGEFEHRVSVLDLLFNAGGQSQSYMKRL